MKQKAIVIGCYTLLVLIGGLIGFFIAHSLISLIASSVFTLLLLSCSALVWKGHVAAYHTAMGVIFCLFLFFSYRFALTHKLMPAGIMALMSGCLFIYLAITRKQISAIHN